MNTFKFYLKTGLACATLLLTFSNSYAQFNKPEDAIKYRQSVFTVQAHAFGEINAMNKGKIPFDIKAIQSNAHIISTLSTLPWSAFDKNTEHAKTKSSIWTDPTAFKTAADKYMIAANKLEIAAKTGDANQIKTATGNLGATCKQCHDAFKK